LPGRDLDGNLTARQQVRVEPVHDLDIETQLSVRRDCALPSDVATSGLAIEEDGLVQEQESGHGDALHQRPAEPAPLEQFRQPGLQERKELDGIPGRIEPLEVDGAKQRLGGLGRCLAVACARRLALEKLAG
jgi:hypothetical protein